MKLFALGEFGEPALPGSLSAILKLTRPLSAKMVGLSSLTVTTSENSVAPKAPGSAPEAATSSLITRYDDAVPWRTRSPHEADARITTKTLASRIRRPHTAFLISLAPDDARRDENQQLAGFVRCGVAVEQPADGRH